MIELNQVRKTFGPRVAVDDLSLTIQEGTIFGLLGPNGSGKTTLLRMITGLLQPTSGSIRLFDGFHPGEMTARRLLGYMPQELAVYQGLSVLENILFMGRIYGLPEADLKARALEVAAMVDLSDRLDSVVGSLSGGLMRRVMLATALVHRPRMMLLDEPTAGVDPVLRIRFWNWFEELRQAGTSIIITTHHISEASRCGQVVFLRDGKLLESGTPDELNQRYGVTDLEQAFVHATGFDAQSPGGEP